MRFSSARALTTGVVLGAAGLLPLASHAQLVSFPGAEGAGRFTKGGRGTATQRTTVFEVTNLLDTNTAGSLRYACSASTTTYPYRTIVFRVCGTIHLTTRLNIPRNTTIAGQTAPGDGICVSDKQVTVNGDNVIVRFVRFRLGDKNQNLGMVNGSGDEDALDGTGRKNVVIDHCTMSWSNDEAFTFYGQTTDSMTLQWNMISEPLNYSYHFETGDTDYERHGYGGIWGGRHASFHHNLFAHCLNRTPRWNGIRDYAAGSIEYCDYSNNVIYNWGSNNVYGGEGGHYNMVNNYYKYGPSTTNGARARILNPYKQASPVLAYPQVYLTGNYVDGSALVTGRNWRGVLMNGGATTDTVQSKVTTPFAFMPTTLQDAQSAYNSVLNGVGCVLPARDALDQRIINDVRNRTGAIIDVQGGYPHGTAYSVSQAAWPTLSCGSAAPDTDHDGMTDVYENSHNLDPNNPNDRYGVASNGYTNLENYLNGLVAANVAYPLAAKGSAADIAATLQVYPNPTEGQLTLVHPVASREARIMVYNYLGQPLRTVTPTSGAQETLMRLDNLAQGHYLLVFSDGNSRGSCQFVRE